MPRVEILDRTALGARCRAAADWGAAAAGTLAGEGHPQARIAARLGDELAVAFWPDGEPPPSCPGLVVIASRPSGLRVDLAGRRCDVPGVGAVRVLLGDDTETAAALAAGAADATPGDLAAVDASPVQTAPAPPAENVLDEGHSRQAPLPGCAPRLRLLGPVRVEGLGEPRRAQLVEMAALLALHQQGCSWKTFCEVIWRDRDTEGPPASKTVHNRVAELRSWLGGPDAVISGGGNLRLGHDVDVDWWRFEAFAARPETIGQALALVEGRPLQGVLEGWAERDYWATSIEAAVIAVALAAADDALRRGAWDRGVAAVEIGLKLCPFDQRLTRAAMRAAAGGGDTGLVHAFVARAEAHLEEDEGLDPETIDLLRRLTTDSA
jgi:DNA-binding SARP family transcriptional activator